MFHLYYIGCVFVYLMYIYLSSEIHIYLSVVLELNCLGDIHDSAMVLTVKKRRFSNAIKRIAIYKKHNESAFSSQPYLHVYCQ